MRLRWPGRRNRRRIAAFVTALALGYSLVLVGKQLGRAEVADACLDTIGGALAGLEAGIATAIADRAAVLEVAGIDSDEAAAILTECRLPADAGRPSWCPPGVETLTEAGPLTAGAGERYPPPQ